LILSVMLFAWTGPAVAEKVPVFVSILPQKYFVEKVGGDRVDVSVMVPPGASPATYEPRPKQMAAISGARIYCAIGVPFEQVWLEKIIAANPDMLVVHTDRGVEKIPMGDRHDHGEQQRHGHGMMDPHIWLSPPLVKIQAANILEGLVKVDPVHRREYEANCNRFSQELDALDAELRGIFAGKRDLEFMVFHPSWGYFARTYGLKQVPVEVEGKNPKPARLQKLIEHARNRGVKVIFVQPQFSKASAETVANAIGGKIVFADPLALDWMANLRDQAAKFKAALR